MEKYNDEKKEAYLCPMCKGRKQIDADFHGYWSPGDSSRFCDCVLCDGDGFVVKGKNK